MKLNLYTAKDAINESISTDSIVHVLSLDVVQIELLRECENWSETGEDENGAIYEYWGTTDDGDTWRVHVHGTTGH